MEIIIILLAIILILLFFVTNKQKHQKNNVQTMTTDHSADETTLDMPYELKYLLTKNEYSFYKVLKQITDENNLLICPKVGLKDIFNITVKTDYMKHFGKISQKHFDFLICDSELHLLFAIELDDSSHTKEQVKLNDKFKNEITDKTNLKLIRIKAQQKYSYEEVRELIKDNKFIKEDIIEQSNEEKSLDL